MNFKEANKLCSNFYDDNVDNDNNGVYDDNDDNDDNNPDDHDHDDFFSVWSEMLCVLSRFQSWHIPAKSCFFISPKRTLLG